MTVSVSPCPLCESDKTDARPVEMGVEVRCRDCGLSVLIQ